MTSRGTIVSPSCRGACDPALSELDYVLRNFEANFANWRSKRIVLHGVRDYARAIDDAFDATYRFEALVAQPEDASADGFGKTVWSNEQLLAEKPDLVILTERVRHAEAVYQEIGTACREAGIALFDMYGIDWLALRDEIDVQGRHTIEEWLEIATPFDVVSIEVPDVLMRPNAQESSIPLTAQPHMLRLVERLRTHGKRVVFVGRKPYTPEEQIASLEHAGFISQDDDSHDAFFMRAGEDGSWRTIRAAYPQARILHAGYGIPKECVLPRYYGVNTYRMLGIVDDGNGRIAQALDPSLLQKELDEAIGHAHIVSFDIFDTLLARTTLIAEDVFEIVENKALDQGIPAEGFARARSGAQAVLHNPSLAELGEFVQAKLGLTSAQRDILLSLELETEREVLVRREDLCQTFNEAVEASKRVFLVSDMYLPTETLAQILAERGITGYESLLVSCDCGALKCEGLLANLTTLGVPPSAIVHIGNGPSDDVEQAEALGMQAVLVPSPLALALAHGYGHRMHGNMTGEERLALGAEIATTFNSPLERHALAAFSEAPASTPILTAPSSIAQKAELFVDAASIRVAPHDERVPVELRRALLVWHRFARGDRALFLGSDREAFAPLLEAHYDEVDFALEPDTAYDCIVALDLIEQDADEEPLMSTLADALAPNGQLLVGFRNRFGLKYLCGAIDDVVKHPFDTLAAHRPGVFGLHEMLCMLDHAGLSPERTYHVMPDPSFAQAIYTDDYIPTTGIHDRLMPFDSHESPLVASEFNLYPSIVEEGMLPSVANYYLVACRKPDAPSSSARRIIHVALSLDRGLEHSFITTLFDDGTVLKEAAFDEGRAALEAVFANGRALRARGVATVDAELQGDGLHMPFVDEQPLLAYLDALLPHNVDAFAGVFEQLYDDILRSSELTSIGDAEARQTWGLPAVELGPILETGFADMVPYNAFWSDGTIRYFDQEFSIAKCPAKYVLFRALRYTWIHLPHAEQAIPLAHLKRRFGLELLWKQFLLYDEAFVKKNRNRGRYKTIHDWAQHNDGEFARRRHSLMGQVHATGRKPYRVGLLMGVFDLFHVGHLRLIKRAKERCEYLRVAVLSDDLVRTFKNITPTIPLEQRMEILAAIDGVDEVVAIEDTPSRLVEWHRRPFDCFFSGDDYAGNESWAREREELEKLGATIEFFSYTEEQSSSNIRSELGRRESGKPS